MKLFRSMLNVSVFVLLLVPIIHRNAISLIVSIDTGNEQNLFYGSIDFSSEVYQGDLWAGRDAPLPPV